jgi:hypothetical protein
MPREAHDERLVDGITHIYEARDAERLVQQIGNPTVAAWFETWLKQRLALAVLRCRFNEWGHVRAADALDDLGVEKQDIMTLVEPERRDWRGAFVKLGLDAAQEVAQQEPMPAVVLERLIDDAMTELTHAGRGVPFGPEPVCAFLWGLRCEALNLRLVVAGVAAGMPRDAIAEDIRQTYV